jgi:RNA polymerase sigma-70 factor, ECF subfamily
MNEPPPPRGVEDAPDEALVRASALGDERAFRLLVRRYLRKAMAIALTYMGTREDAEDVVQEAFRRVYQSLDRFDTRRAFQPWFFTILRNSARNALHSTRARATEPLSDAHPGEVPDAFDRARRLQLRRSIDEAVSQLPPMQKTCFELCVVEGFSSAEAASAVGLAESTVRVHVFKARQTLQRLLDSWRRPNEDA